MLAEYKEKTYIGISLEVIAYIFGIVIGASGDAVGARLGSLFMLGGNFLFIWHCYSFARGRVYNGAWGLLGLLGIFGLIILLGSRLGNFCIVS